MHSDLSGKTALVPDVEHKDGVALLVAATFFMENLDATVITTALPAMASDFHTSPARLSIGISAYLVALTVLIPAGGWVADRFGARRVFAWAIVVFTLSSALCAASRSLFEFTAARILQGLAGALMVPVGRLVVLRGTPKERLVWAIAVLTWPALIAPVLGPALGGWISTYWSWHWIFLLNVPLGLLSLLFALRLIHDGPRAVGDFDSQGFGLSAAGFTLFMVGLELASSHTGSPVWVLTLVAGSALLVLSARHLQRVEHPLFSLTPLSIDTFRVTAVGGSLFRTAIFSAPFLLPLMFQVGFGWSAVRSGLLLLWLFAGNLCMKPATTWVMQRLGFRKVLIGNGLLVAAGLAACGLLSPSTPEPWVAALLFVCGMSRSMQFTAFNTLGFADVPPQHMRDATTLFSLFQQTNAGTGIAVGALALTLAELIHGSDLAQPALTDFRLALGLTAVVALLGVIDSLRLPAQAGQGVLKPAR